MSGSGRFSCLINDLAEASGKDPTTVYRLSKMLLQMVKEERKVG